jgi:hypothetical protein
MKKKLQTCKDLCDGYRSMKIGPIIKPLISNHNVGELILWDLMKMNFFHDHVTERR